MSGMSGTEPACETICLARSVDALSTLFKIINNLNQFFLIKRKKIAENVIYSTFSAIVETVGLEPMKKARIYSTFRPL